MEPPTFSPCQQLLSSPSPDVYSSYLSAAAAAANATASMAGSFSENAAAASSERQSEDQASSVRQFQNFGPLPRQSGGVGGHGFHHLLQHEQQQQQFELSHRPYSSNLTPTSPVHHHHQQQQQQLQQQEYPKHERSSDGPRDGASPAGGLLHSSSNNMPDLVQTSAPAVS